MYVKNFVIVRAMTIALIVLGVASLLEVPLWWLKNDLVRRLLSYVSSVLAMVAAIALLFVHPAVWSLLVVVLSCYRCINLLRVIRQHIHADYLFHAVRRSSVWLMAAQASVLVVVTIGHRFHLRSLTYEYVLLVLQLLVALTLTTFLLHNWRKSKPPHFTKSYAERDLPTVTVAIPARNETEELEDCLDKLTKSTYPKLEILVLDDCSQNGRTPEIIRGFAHDGVRFVSGDVPPENWLAKNFAYEQLVDEANGELIIFCGVDVKFSPDSIRLIVETMIEKKKTMISWLPENQTPKGSKSESLLVQPVRYAWELALPRRVFRRPPVLSSCWVIESKKLRTAGGFKAISHSISPESYFARQAVKDKDGYSFLWADRVLGLSSTKTLDEQRDTAIRTRYPQLHRRIELVVGLSIVEFTVFVSPFISLVVSYINHTWLVTLLSGEVGVCLIVFYTCLVSVTYRRFLLRGLWLAPFAALYDIALLNYSMTKYEFGKVIWKGRNICIPVMRVIPKLPTVG